MGQGFTGGSVVKNSLANAEDVGINVGQKDPLEKENRNPFQYSCLKNSMDREAWRATGHGVAKSQTRLSD